MEHRMRIDLSAIAYAIRTHSAQSLRPIKLSHAQQCVAAALGHRSLASLQASDDLAQPLERETHIVLDAQALGQRRQELALEIQDEELLALVVKAFGERLDRIGVHTSRDAFLEALRNQVEQGVLNDSAVVAETTVTNNDGIREIYLPFDIGWDQVPEDGDTVETPFQGHIAMGIDEERPYLGHRVDVKASVWVSRPGRAIWMAGWTVESAQLDRSFFEGDEEEEGPRVIDRSAGGRTRSRLRRRG
jgi:hypothetical protein